MTTETIEAVWKDGKIVPVGEVEVDVEEGIIFTVTISLPEKPRKSILSLAGVWKNFRTWDGKTIDVVKEEIYKSRNISTRKEALM